MSKIEINTRPQLNELQEFSYAETSVLAGLVTTGEAIALRPVVENLGLDWSSQLKRLKRDPNLNQLWSQVKMKSTDGKMYDMVCLPPVAFQNWLFDFSPSENLNITLWEEYKKGLVVHLLMMLKISLDEVARLRRIESLYKQQKAMTMSLLGYDEEASEAVRRGRERRKQKQVLLESLRNNLHTDPNQLSIED